jgi:hypothetical protein
VRAVASAIGSTGPDWHRGSDHERGPDTEEHAEEETVEMKTWLMRLFGRERSDQLDCHEVGELLQQYLDHEIDEHRAQLIADHLDDCRRCGLEAETYERIKRTLAARRDEVSEESVERLREFGRGLIRGDEPSAP